MAVVSRGLHWRRARAAVKRAPLTRLQRLDGDGAAPELAHDPLRRMRVAGRPETLRRLRVDAADQRFRQSAHDLSRDGFARVDELHAGPTISAISGSRNG